MRARFAFGAFLFALVGSLFAPLAAPVRAADDVIIFGAAVSLTGSLSKEGHLTQEGYDFWKDWINAHGGFKVGGKTYKVDIKYYDDESSPQTAARLTEKLIDQDHVGLYPRCRTERSSTFSAAAVAERKKVPMVQESRRRGRAHLQPRLPYTFGVLSPAKRIWRRDHCAGERWQHPRGQDAGHLGLERCLLG